MVRCPNCGAPREGDKCEYCGTKFFDEDRQTKNSQVIINASAVKQREEQVLQVEPASKKSRPVLTGLFMFCLFGAIVMTAMGIANGRAILAGAVMYSVFALMFFVLSKTPKGSVYLLGKKRGIKKKFFIWACIYAACIGMVVINVL